MLFNLIRYKIGTFNSIKMWLVLIVKETVF